jgi:hypothetical protein
MFVNSSSTIFTSHLSLICFDIRYEIFYLIRFCFIAHSTLSFCRPLLNNETHQIIRSSTEFRSCSSVLCQLCCVQLFALFLLSIYYFRSIRSSTSHAVILYIKICICFQFPYYYILFCVVTVTLMAKEQEMLKCFWLL